MSKYLYITISKIIIVGLSFCALSQNLTLAHAADAIATAVKLSTQGANTRFEAELSKATGFNVSVLQNPYRVVIDLAGVSFDLPPGTGHGAKGVISSFRYGLIEEGKSRIVIDTAGPVLIAKSFAAAAKGKKPARLVVDLVASSQASFNAAFAKEHPEATATATITPTSQPAAQPLAPQLKTIVIDPGHGGIDPGASSPDKIREKDVVLAYGLALRNILEKSGHYNIVMTRSDDRFVRLDDRVKIAREHKADLFIAIHADTVKGLEARGITLYTVSDKATDAEAEELAQKENRADIIAGLDLASANKQVADILINLAQRESKNQAMYFSKKAVKEIQVVTNMTGKPIRSAAFVVLKAPDVPSVLIELGYLSSKHDEALLVSPEWQVKMAQAMATAIDKYFAPAVAVTQN